MRTDIHILYAKHIEQYQTNRRTIESDNKYSITA